MTMDAKLTYAFIRDVAHAVGNDDFDAVNHGIPAPDSVGKGHPLILNIEVNEDFAGGTSSFVLQDSADGSSWADCIVVQPATAAATLVKGWAKRIALPETVRQYTRVRNVIAGSALSAGKVSAYLTES